MKIATGAKTVDGPWGGGNQFARALVDYLHHQGWEVTFELTASDIDLILLTDARKESGSRTFGPKEIARYLLRHPRTHVVHRVNECDERKNTIGTNEQLMRGNLVADHTVFISSWLRELFQKYRPFTDDNSTVIRNGAEHTIFQPLSPPTRWDGRSPIKLVTHHWAGHWMKGFDIYALLDELLPQGLDGRPFEFTYIGRIPENFTFHYATHIPPKSGAELAHELAQHHVYVTGSQNEPGGMHHIEGCLCGLPPVYRRSGALTEHCRDFGVGFQDVQDVVPALKKMCLEYDTYADKIASYPYTAAYMCEQYERMFLRVLNRRLSIPEVGKKLFRSIQLIQKG